jgi:hypothetical protein
MHYKGNNCRAVAGVITASRVMSGAKQGYAVSKRTSTVKLPISEAVLGGGSAPRTIRSSLTYTVDARLRTVATVTSVHVTYTTTRSS